MLGAPLLMASVRDDFPAPDFFASLIGPSLDAGIGFASQVGTGSGGTGFGTGSYAFATVDGESAFAFVPPVGNDNGGNGPRTRLSISTPLMLGSAWTASLWVHDPAGVTPVESGDPGCHLIAHNQFGGSKMFFLDKPSSQIGWWNGSARICDSGVTLGSGWENFLITFDGTSLALHHKGMQVGTTTTAHNATHFDGIGCSNEGYGPLYAPGGAYFKEFAYWARCLTPIEIAYVGTHMRH